MSRARLARAGALAAFLALAALLGADWRPHAHGSPSDGRGCAVCQTARAATAAPPSSV